MMRSPFVERRGFRTAHPSQCLEGSWSDECTAPEGDRLKDPQVGIKSISIFRYSDGENGRRVRGGERI